MNVKQMKKLIISDNPIIVIYGIKNICEYISRNHGIKLDYYPTIEELKNIIRDFEYYFEYFSGQDDGIWLHEYDENNVSNLEVISLDTHGDRIVINCGYKSIS